MEMFGNGVPTLGIKIIRVRPLMAGFGSLVEIIHAGCCAVAAGTSIPGIVAVPSASAMGRATGTTTTVCVSPACFLGED